MTVIHALRALWCFIWIESKNNRGDLAPVSAFGFSVKQADIAGEMRLVISADTIKLGRLVLEGGHWILSARSSQSESR